jgi:hypothetical protein
MADAQESITSLIFCSVSFASLLFEIMIVCLTVSRYVRTGTVIRLLRDARGFYCQLLKQNSQPRN